MEDQQTSAGDGPAFRASGRRAVVVLLMLITLSALGWSAPIMIVGQGSGNVQISSDGSQPGVFPESNWNMVAPLSHNGVTVAWTITPFVSTKDARSKVDASLGLRLIQASNSSGWQIPIPTDRTDMKLGRNMATVVAQSHRGDNARAGVTVVFCGHEEPSLLEGAYRTELVATITEN